MSVYKLKCGCKVSGDKIIESCAHCQEVWEIYRNAAKRQHDFDAALLAQSSGDEKHE